MSLTDNCSKHKDANHVADDGEDVPERNKHQISQLDYDMQQMKQRNFKYFQLRERRSKMHNSILVKIKNRNSALTLFDTKVGQSPEPSVNS